MEAVEMFLHYARNRGRALPSRGVPSRSDLGITY